jgi:hypothetical protein
VFDDKRGTKPLEVILGVLADPFTRPRSQRPNECKSSLWQDPDVGFWDAAVHCLQSALKGWFWLDRKRRRKTANVR